MKVYVFQNQFGLLTTRRHKDLNSADEYIGTLDLDIQKEKKWVKKETVLSWEGMVTSADQTLDNVFVPKGARNLTLIYEVEE